MKYKITWLNNGFKQVKELTNCKRKDGFFTMNSAIYEAIENGTFCIDLGYGKHEFLIEEFKNKL
jgi:hypothetical protein